MFNPLAIVFKLAWGVILVLVGGRFVALLLNANQGSELVRRLYRHSDFWVQPFVGMLGLTNRAVNETGGVVEPASLLAFLVYLAAGMLVLRLLPSPLRLALPLIRRAGRRRRRPI